jgi:hypothetical protein
VHLQAELLALLALPLIRLDLRTQLRLEGKELLVLGTQRRLHVDAKHAPPSGTIHRNPCARSQSVIAIAISVAEVRCTPAPNQ